MMMMINPHFYAAAVVFMALYWTQYSPYLTLVLNPGLHFLIADARSKVKDPLWPKSSIIYNKQ